MKNTIINLIAVVAVSFGSAALAAEETANKAQSPAVQPAAASAVPATVTESTSAAPPEQPQPEAKRAASSKRAKTKVRPKDMDLRHCLELDNDPAIARCAYE